MSRNEEEFAKREFEAQMKDAEMAHILQSAKVGKKTLGDVTDKEVQKAKEYFEKRNVFTKKRPKKPRNQEIPININAATLINDETFKTNTEIYANCYRKGNYNDVSKMVDSSYREKWPYKLKQWYKIHKRVGDFGIRRIFSLIKGYILYWFYLLKSPKPYYGYRDLEDMMKSTGGMPYKGILGDNRLNKYISAVNNSPNYQLSNFMERVEGSSLHQEPVWFDENTENVETENVSDESKNTNTDDKNLTPEYLLSDEQTKQN